MTAVSFRVFTAQSVTYLVVFAADASRRPHLTEPPSFVISAVHSNAMRLIMSPHYEVVPLITRYEPPKRVMSPNAVL